MVQDILTILGGDLEVAARDALERVPGEEVPAPCRALLVHERDMTRTLEAFAGERLGLRTLEMGVVEGVMVRRILLEAQDRPVEYGAIRIQLAAFPDRARARILSAEEPLGRILHEESVEYLSRPRAYLRFRSSGPAAEALGVPAGTVLYGRHNVLSRPDGVVLAEAVEFLPPFQDEPGPDSAPDHDR